MGINYIHSAYTNTRSGKYIAGVVPKGMQAITMITACSLCNIYLWTFGDYDTCRQYDLMQSYDTIADIISMATKSITPYSMKLIEMHIQH